MTKISGSITSTMSPFTQSLTGTIERAIQIIDGKESIPRDAKKAIIDYLKEESQDILDNLSDLANRVVPENIGEYWDLVVEVILTLTNAL